MRTVGLKFSLRGSRNVNGGRIIVSLSRRLRELGLQYVQFIQMIACSCRTFIRIDRVWKVGNLYVLSKPVDYFQCYAYRNLSYIGKMGGAKDGRSHVDWNKKQKTVTAVWRPVSTLSSSHEGCLAKDVNIQPGNPYMEVNCNEKAEGGAQIQVVQCSTSGHVSDAQNFVKEGEVMSELANSTSRGFQCNDQDEAQEDEEPMLSANIKAESLSQSQYSTSDTNLDGTFYQVQVKKDSVVKLDAGENVHLVSVTEKHSISVEVASSLFRFVKGKGGSTQKDIEGEMDVKIKFPTSKKENSIIIEGTSIESITKASHHIQAILEKAVKSPNLDYSHFVSLPLAIHPGLVDKLINFQNSILGSSDPTQEENLDGDSHGDTSDDGEDKDRQLAGGLDVAVKLKIEDATEHVKVDINKIPFKSYPSKASKPILSDLGIDRSIFIKPKTFHLTVLMLKLWNKERIIAASEILQRIASKVKDALNSRPIFIRLKGLECMRGSLAKARVLYVPVEEIGSEDRLLRACQVIIDAYVEAGLVLEKDAQQKLKLHATVMNARHRKSKKKTRRDDSFDARGIFKQYGSEEWGEYLIFEAHLSRRFVFDENGYYHCCSSIPFPENMQVE